MHHPGRSTNLSRTLLVLLAFAGLLSVGCTTRVYGRGYARGYVRYSAPVVFAQAPDLVYVEPGVYVVRNYNDAVYYSDGYYWSSRGGVWYRTAHWSDPWVTVHVGAVPRTFVHRDHRVYAHYHGTAGAHTYRAPDRTYHAAAPGVHHGSPAPAAPPPTAKASAAGDIDHHAVRRGQDDNDRSAVQSPGDRSAHTDRSKAQPSESQAKVIAPQSDRQATAPVTRQPARSEASKPKSRSSDSAPSRSAPSRSKSKRR
jgi:hypothetical protein